MLRVVVRCPEAPVVSILTDIKVDQKFLNTVADTFVSVECPHCRTSHVKRLKYCKAYKLAGSGKEAA